MGQSETGIIFYPTLIAQSPDDEMPFRVRIIIFNSNNSFGGLSFSTCIKISESFLTNDEEFGSSCQTEMESVMAA